MKLAKMGYGNIAFLLGLVLALISAAAVPTIDLTVALGISVFFAVVVALVNITTKETHIMVLWTIAMGVVGIGILSQMAVLGPMIAPFVQNVGVYFTAIAAVFLVKLGYNIFGSK